MNVLFIRTDSEEATVGISVDGKSAEKTWKAGRELSKTILLSIEEVVDKAGVSKDSVSGVVLFKGPGSFTGLRIGASVAGAFSLGLDIPMVSESGDNWLDNGIKRLEAGENEEVPTLEYGAEANITKPKK